MESQMGERISDRLCGRILLKQANLDELQREMVSLRGPVLRTFDEVANMLRPLDSSDEDEEGYPYVYFEDREHDELEAVEIMAYHAAYRDVRRELQKRKNERGYVSRDRAKGSSKGSRFVRKGKGKSKGKKGKISFQQRNSNKGYEDDLEQRTRCWNCQELGHFSKNCPLSSRGAGSSSTSASTRRQQQFVVNNGQQSFATQQYMQFSMRPLPGQNPQVFMHAMQAARISVYAGVVCAPGEALVDTAAEEAVIGTRALQSLQQELKKHGLQTLKVDPLMPLPTAGGIGGQAAVECLVEIPIGVAGSFTVLKDSNDCATPPLLPISFLETIEATIDTKRDLLVAGNGNTAPMRRLPTRHRATSILNFADNKWSLPVQHRKDPAIDPF